MTYRLPSRFERLRSRGLLAGAELAAQLEANETAIHLCWRPGLPRRRIYEHDNRYLYEPVGDVVLVRGAIGPKATQATFIVAPLAGQIRCAGQKSLSVFNTEQDDPGKDADNIFRILRQTSS